MESLIKISNLRKTYPGVTAVDNLSFEVNKGEVLALIGENGAGKSTTMKMISGVTTPDSGKIEINAVRYSFKNPEEASKAGVGIVFQELSLVDSLSVAENIFMNRQPVNKNGNINFKELYKDTEKILDIFKLDIKPQTKVATLSAGRKQMVEILKAISHNPKLLILDEPTSSLTESEIELLFKVIRDLKEQGMAFIYISHKMSEIFEITDKAVIMRDGKFVEEDKIENLNEQKIVSLMVGREIKDLFGAVIENRIKNKEVFKVKNLSKKGLYNNVSFSVKSGEIVGIYGLIGAGRTEMAMGIFGYYKNDKGDIYIDSQKVNINSTKNAIKNKIAYITEDRKELGLYLDKDIKENLVATNIKRFCNGIGSINGSKVQLYSKNIIDKYRIVAYSTSQQVGKLSGGNQQKILLAMWMELKPHIIIFDEPTRGVDVGAKSEIYASIKEYSAEGNGSIVISSETTELMGICDRIIIMKAGEVVGEVCKSDFTEERIISYATGININ